MSKKKNIDKVIVTPENLLETYLKDQKEYHFNPKDQEEEKRLDVLNDYKVSTGSLLLDEAMDGGIGPGIVRFTGCAEGGKTSAALTVMQNFLKTVENSRGIYVKAEGRLSKEMQSRFDIDFVYVPDEWKNGNVFVFNCNVFETVTDLLRNLMKNNESKIRYCLIIDSVDGLNRKEDLQKLSEEATRVAGGAVISSLFLKRMSNYFSTYGHLAIFISQVRSNVQLNPYEKADPKLTNATGGNALLHYPNWIIEYQQRFKNNLIFDKSNNIIGHKAVCVFKKTPNETTNNKYEYPIKYNAPKGKSVWRELEIADLLLLRGYVIKRSSWLSPTQFFIDKCKGKGIEFPDQLQGQDKLIEFVSNENIVDSIFNILMEH
ncbi:MAG: hypothetical protein HC836_24285 [Richelia sp. RM2_1_2]|nr:hypothetical protein [Richelia sp. RM2_1_2]